MQDAGGARAGEGGGLDWEGGCCRRSVTHHVMAASAVRPQYLNVQLLFVHTWGGGSCIDRGFGAD